MKKCGDFHYLSAQTGNKDPSKFRKKFQRFGKIGEYRLLSETEDCIIVRVENETGEGDMIIYYVFDGVVLMYNDFHMSSYHSMYQSIETIFAVDYCREGTLTMEWENGRYYMKNSGNICIDSRVHHKGMVYFPTNHYHGITIGFVSDLAEKTFNQQVPGIPINLRAIREKFCEKDGYSIIQNDSRLQNIFTDLYRVPEEAKLPYFRAKVLELLVCLSTMEIKQQKGSQLEGVYFYKDNVEKTRSIQKLITENMDCNYTIKALATEFDISQTGLKMCFKSLYGKPIYTWLKEYRIGKAKEYLTHRKEMSIGEIANAVGYSSQAKFGVVFKKLCGMTPREYRNQKY